jgi:hypothetical protein
MAALEDAAQSIAKLAERSRFRMGVFLPELEV